MPLGVPEDAPSKTIGIQMARLEKQMDSFVVLEKGHAKLQGSLRSTVRSVYKSVFEIRQQNRIAIF